MFLIQLVYVSQAKPNLHLNDIRGILNAAEAHNAAHGITGALFFNHQYFIQCLEGSRAEVNRLYQKIEGDPRHTNSQIYLLRDITARSFNKWSMGFASHTKMNKAIFLKYHSAPNFDPLVMSGLSALDFLVDATQYFETI